MGLGLVEPVRAVMGIRGGIEGLASATLAPRQMNRQNCHCIFKVIQRDTAREGPGQRKMARMPLPHKRNVTGSVEEGVTQLCAHPHEPLSRGGMSLGGVFTELWTP